MIIESIDDCKRLKQLLGLIQSSTLPPMKGIDAFAVHNTCEWVFDQCIKFQKKESEKSNGVQEKKEKDSEEIKIENKIELPVMPPKKKKSAIRKRGKK